MKHNRITANIPIAKDTLNPFPRNQSTGKKSNRPAPNAPSSGVPALGRRPCIHPRPNETGRQYRTVAVLVPMIYVFAPKSDRTRSNRADAQLPPRNRSFGGATGGRGDAWDGPGRSGGNSGAVLAPMIYLRSGIGRFLFLQTQSVLHGVLLILFNTVFC